MKKIAVILVSLLLHTIAIAIIIAAFLPMAKWYFDAKPLWGVDFYYTVALVRQILNHLTLPPLGWGYAWFSGWPLVSNYPILHYYLIIPFVSAFGVIGAVKIWSLVTLGLFCLGVYFATFVVSRNWIVALLVALGTIFSVSIYGGLMWGGGIPNHATQAFYPWVVGFYLLYLSGWNKRWLFVAILLTGLAIWGHPQIVIAYIFPTIGLLSIFSFGRGKFIQRIKSYVIFLTLSVIIGLPVFYAVAGGAFKSLFVVDALLSGASSTVEIPSETQQAITEFHRRQPWRIIEDNHSSLFILLVPAVTFYLLSWIFRYGWKRLFAVVPFVLLAAFYVGYIWIYAYGISIYHGGWYRLFWSVPVWASLLTAAFWGEAQGALLDKNKKGAKYLRWLVPLASLGILVVGVWAFNTYSTEIREKVVARSQASSAYPDVLNLRDDDRGLAGLKKELVPVWLNGDQKDFRLYTPDQRINLWWNSVFDMPLARGYFDPPVTPAQRGYFFWMDAALNQSLETHEDQLAGSFGYPPEIAYNNSLFLLDWYAIKYLEAGHEGIDAPLAPSLTDTRVMKQEAVIDFNREKYNEYNQTLRYYEVNDQLVSPILQATNAPTLGIVASEEGYETVVRALADANLGAGQVIPVRLERNLEKLNAAHLSDLDALILYDYTYVNRAKAFSRLSEYLKRGKKLFIDTGVEGKESAAQNLPDIFPITKTTRETMGREWNLTVVDKKLIGEVDVSQFDPPLFDEYEWKFSYPDIADIRDGAIIHLSNSGKPLLVSQTVGRGEIIWSGMNFPYHVGRFHNSEEVTVWKNIITTLLPSADAPVEINSKSEFVSAGKRIVTTSGARGVLFKEQAYSGWNAKIRSGSGSRTLPIYRVGPTFPGFIYVRLPQDLSTQKVTVTFSYGGESVSWFTFSISVILVLFLLDEVFTGGRTVNLSSKKILNKLYKYMSRWWEKDEVA